MSLFHSVEFCQWELFLCVLACVCAWAEGRGFRPSGSLPSSLAIVPRQGRGAAGGCLTGLPPVHPAGLGHRERGSVQDPQARLQDHPLRRLGQHPGQTGGEIYSLVYFSFIQSEQSLLHLLLVLSIRPLSLEQGSK